MSNPNGSMLPKKPSTRIFLKFGDVSRIYLALTPSSRIERIIIPADELMKLNQFLNSKHTSDITKRNMIN